MANKSLKTMQLCWDCARAVGGCDWSREHIPIPGWEATPAVRNGDSSYVITGCPEFVRDAYGCGSYRNPPLTAEQQLEHEKRYLEIRRREARKRYYEKSAKGEVQS